jgi:replicative DNA helicase
MTLLRLLRTRERYEKLRRAVPDAVLDLKTKTILDDFGKYFREFTDVTRIEQEPFWLWFRSFAHPKLNDEQRALYHGLLKQVQEPVDPALEAGLMARMVAAKTASDLLGLIERFNEGEELDFGSQLRSTIEQFELDTNRKVKTPWVQDDINDLLAEDANDTGFHWRLDELNLAMRPLRSGDFGIIAARPDVGKTSFLTDQLSHMAAQVDTLFPDEKRTILWFNNEGPGNRIVKRLFQSALNETASGLVARSQAGTIGRDYVTTTGGRPHILRVFDIHDFWNHEVEDIIRQFPPALIVLDMVDNIKFGGAVSNNGQRTDQLLEAMYQWARVQAVKHDCPVLATSQISADGENLCYPTLSMLKDSKTGKQGAADFILTVGYNADFPSSRYLGLTKNKLAREGGPKQLKAEVVFDGQRGRYVTPSQFNGAA